MDSVADHDQLPAIKGVNHTRKAQVVTERSIGAILLRAICLRKQTQASLQPPLDSSPGTFFHGFSSAPDFSQPIPCPCQEFYFLSSLAGCPLGWWTSRNSHPGHGWYFPCYERALGWGRGKHSANTELQVTRLLSKACHQNGKVSQ